MLTTDLLETPCAVDSATSKGPQTRRKIDGLKFMCPGSRAEPVRKTVTVTLVPVVRSESVRFARIALSRLPGWLETWAIEIRGGHGLLPVAREGDVA